jgi:gamma-glutamyltranspeptidase
MLNILEVCVPKLGFNLGKLGPGDPTYWHLMIEAKKLAYADLNAYNGDPKFSTIPVDKLLAKTYAATLCGKINPESTRTKPTRRRTPEDSKGERSISPRPIAGATWFRSFTACSACMAAVSPYRLTVSCFTIVEGRSR